MKRVDGWQFSRAEGGGWIWSHFDEKTSAPVIADRKFPSLSECMNDAAKHGYHTKARARVNHRSGPPERITNPVQHRTKVSAKR